MTNREKIQNATKTLIVNLSSSIVFCGRFNPPPPKLHLGTEHPAHPLIFVYDMSPLVPLRGLEV